MVPTLPQQRQTSQKGTLFVTQPGFLVVEKTTPASLLLLQLLMAGIEPNPGPAQKVNCKVCSRQMKTQTIRCHQCKEWMHLKCSGMRKTAEYLSQPDWRCPPCTAETPRQTQKVKFKLLQLNCNGIQNKAKELSNYLQERKITVAALQETKLQERNKTPKFPGYTAIRRDRGQGGGGLMTLIHETVDFNTMDIDQQNDGTREVQGVNIKMNEVELNIINYYIPPSSSCPQGYKASLQDLLSSSKTILVGDANAHSSLWHSSNQEDTRGSELAEEIKDSSFGVLNTDHPTRLPRGDQPSSPEISMASSDLLLDLSWKTEITLGSDHLPMKIELKRDTEVRAPKRTFVNLSRADWDTFKQETEELFLSEEEPSDTHSGEKVFRKILNTASAHNIPSGRIPKAKPNIPPAASRLIKQRDETRRNNPHSKDIPTLNARIDFLISKQRMEKWKEHVATFDRKTNVTKLWKTIGAITGKKQSAPPNQGIKFNEKQIKDASSMSNAFNIQYARPMNHKTEKDNRKISRNIKKQPLNDAPVITSKQVKTAIQNAKNSKAFGPDNISTTHMKHLGPNAINYLTKIFNLSLSKCQIPAIWKSSVIIPLLKPGKDAGLSNSYRPVSLLCPASKILEKCIQPLITEHLHFASHQHGFRSKHSTVTALCDITTAISNGFNRKKPADRTLLVAIDLSKAFDTVKHSKLLDLINKTSLPSALKRWLANFLQGRQARTLFRDSLSKARIVRFGVPQGSVLSPLLFNYYVADAPSPTDEIKIKSYADDFTSLILGTDIPAMAGKQTEYLAELRNFFEERNLQISIDKSFVTLMTPQTAQYKTVPEVKINNEQIRMNNQAKILGITFDTMHTFGAHCRDTAKKCSQRNNALKALAGTDWGSDKETLLMTYKAVVRSKLEYGAAVITPTLSESNIEKLQKVQNSALRTITGCHAMTHIDHLHQETSVLPVRRHLRMRTIQHHLANHLPDHPGNQLTKEPKNPPRLMKETLQTRYEERYIEPLLDSNRPLTEKKYRNLLKTIHTNEVRDALQTYEYPAVLGHNPPKIAKEETELPRTTRRTLAQLRSGYSKFLNSYMNRIDPTVSELCPDCQQTSHTTIHLFDCIANPTNLTPADLWKQPKKTAIFLKLPTTLDPTTSDE